MRALESAPMSNPSTKSSRNTDTQQKATPQISFDSLLFGEEPAAPPVEVRSTIAPAPEPRAPEIPAPWTGTEPLRAAAAHEAEQGATKTDQAKRQVEEGFAQLAEALAAGKSESLVRWLDTMSRFHNYSLNNTILIAFQNPEATHVAGFHTWKDMGRSVKKGEKGIMILAPIPKRVKASEEGEAQSAPLAITDPAQDDRGRTAGVWGFRVVYVFDIAQTEGKELPEFAHVQGDPAEHLDQLKALVKSEGIALEYVKGLQGADGVSLKGMIKLVEGLTPAREFSVLVHELAHELLHKDPQRRERTTKTVRETEAEGVAYVVCRAIGLDTGTQHADYIQLYRGSVETLTQSLTALQAVSTKILSALDLKGAIPKAMPSSEKKPATKTARKKK